TTVPASKALTMNWYWSISCRSRTGFQLTCGAESLMTSSVASSGGVGMACLLFQADHEDPAAAVLDHLDGRPVDRAEALARDHLGRRPDGDTSLGDVHDKVEVRKERVDVVRHQHHRQPPLAPDVVEQLHDRGPAADVEVRERLVQQQDP